MAQARRFARIDPEPLRDLLSDSTAGLLANTPSANSATEWIGVMPNLKAIHPQLQELPA